MFQKTGMKEGGKPLPLAFQYLILIIWGPCDLDLTIKLRWLQNAKTLKLGCPFFSHFMKWSLKCWHFEASKDIITKFKSQVLYIIRIKYWNASGCGPLPSLIPTSWNIGILNYKQAKLRKHLQHNSVSHFHISCQNSKFSWQNKKLAWF